MGGQGVGSGAGKDSQAVSRQGSPGLEEGTLWSGWGWDDMSSRRTRGKLVFYAHGRRSGLGEGPRS